MEIKKGLFIDIQSALQPVIGSLQVHYTYPCAKPVPQNCPQIFPTPRVLTLFSLFAQGFNFQWTLEVDITRSVGYY